MAGETTFTLTFKTIAQLTGLDQLMNGVQAGTAKVEALNTQLAASASAVNGVMARAAESVHGLVNRVKVGDIEQLATGGTARVVSYDDWRAKSAALNATDAEGLAIAQKQALQQAAVALQMERRVIMETGLEAAEARIAGNPALAVRLEREADIRARALTIQRTLNITTEEAIVLAERMVLAEEATAVATNTMGVNMAKAKTEALVLGREMAAGNVRASTLSSLLGSLGTSFTISALSAYELYQILDSAAHQSLLLAQETRKQTDELVRQLTAWNELAQAAGDFGDVIKFGEKIEPELTKAAAKLEEFRNKELSAWKLLWDSIAQQLGSSIPGHGPRPFQESKDAQTASEASALASLTREGEGSRETAQQAANTWQSIKLERLNDAIAQQGALLDQAREKYAALDSEAHKLAVGNLDDAGTQRLIALQKELDDAGARVQLQTKRLGELTATETKLATETDKVAEALKKLDLGELTNPQKLEEFSTKIDGIQAKLLELGVDANSPNQALEKSKTLTAEIREEVIKLVAEWARILGLVVQINQEDSKVNAQLAAFEEKQAVLSATAYGSRDEAYKAEWGAKYNNILREREKIGADTSPGAINAQIAAEEKAAERRKEWSAEDRSAGSASRESTDALTAAKQRLTAAEQSYKTTLETTNVLEDSGQITHDQANSRNQQATRDYIAELERIKGTLPGVIAQFEAMGSKGAKGAAEARIEMQQLTNKILEVETTQANSTFFGKIRAQIRQLANDWSDMGKQIGGFLTQTFQNFASTAGNAIGQLIFKTGNWKQSIVQLAQSFVASLATMLIQWVLSRTIMAALNKAFGQADASAASAQASAAAEAWAPAATSASIASYGVAAGTGLAAYLAALGVGTAAAIGMASGGSGGGFQAGGYTGSGPEHKVAGAVHFEEVVFPAPRVRELGRDWLVNMAVGSLTQPGYQRGGIGGGRPGSGTAGPAGIGGGDHTVIVVNDWESAVHQAMRNAKGRTIIVDSVSGRSVDLGLL